MASLLDETEEAAAAAAAAVATANEPATETAFDHFNDPKFFFPVKWSDDVEAAKLEAIVASYNYQMFCSNSNKTKLQKLTLDEFFAEVQTKERAGMTLYDIFRSYKLIEYSVVKNR